MPTPPTPPPPPPAPDHPDPLQRSERHYFADFADLAGKFLVGTGRETLEDFNIGALRELQGAERAEAEQIFSEALKAGRNDPRIVRALVAMEAPGLDELLSQVMRHADETGVTAARARWERTHNKDVIKPLVETLRDPSGGSARLMAVNTLADVGDAASMDPLLAALDLEVEEVRNVATTALLRSVGLEELERRGRSPISRLGALILNPLRSVREPAINELRRIVTAVRSGQSKESLGLVPSDAAESPALARLRDSVFADSQRAGPWKNSIDLASFQTLTGEEKERGLQFIYLLLGRRDPRAVRAIMDLGLRAALPALQEAAGQGNRGFTKLVQEAIAKLSAA